MNTAFKKLNKVEFPKYSNIMINMMPIVMGDRNSVPEYLHGYLPLINDCNFKEGEVVYLSIHESFVEKDKTQRRPGCHTEATSLFGWGGTPWGGKLEEGKGIYMASTDGRCEIWNTIVKNVDMHGKVLNHLTCSSEIMQENTMYWFGDKTPHESLPALQSKERQWFRLVSPEIGIWFSKHNTENPLGVKPNAPISHMNKFF